MNQNVLSSGKYELIKTQLVTWLRRHMAIRRKTTRKCYSYQYLWCII